MGTIADRSHQERGQILMLVALLVTVMLGLIGLVVDTGFWYAERRQVQNAADEATLAAAYEMKYGGSFADATVAALENAAANGYNNDGTTNVVTVNSPPTEGNFAGSPTAIEVVIEDLDLQTFFIQVLMPATGHVEARGVAQLTGGGVIGAPTLPLPVPIPQDNCNATQAVVDGRVMPDEGYQNIANIISTTTSVSYGEAFFSCDGTYYYFGLRLNGPSTGGAVANENVYGGCKSKQPNIDGDEIEKLKGTIESVGASSFTLFADGELWTIQVDGDTSYSGDADDFGDLAPGLEGEVKKGTVLGPNLVLAEEVKLKDRLSQYCSSTSYSTYHSDYNTGWADDAHTFGKLEGSDRARFQISCDGVPVHDFIQDYLTQVGSDWVSDATDDGEVIVAAPDQSASSLEFNLENPSITGWGDDPGENPLEQSPPFDPQYPTYSSEYDGFVWEMLYEFRVPVAAYSGCIEVTFGLNDFGGQAGGLEGLHSSPAKTADGAYLQVEPFDVRLVE